MKVGQALTQLGHDVRLWVPETGQETSWEGLARHYGLHLRFDLCRVPAWAPLRRWDFSAGAVRQSIRWRPDLWYVWPYQAAAALSQMGRATVFEIHDRPAGAAGPSLFRLFLRDAAHAACSSSPTPCARGWRPYRQALQPPFTLIAQRVDLEAYAGLPSPTEARARLGWPEQFTASYSGHLYQGRGLELMVDLARRHPEFAFVWAGGEPEAVRSWKQRLVEAKVSNLRLLGFVPQTDLPMIHAASDVLLMPYGRAIAVSSGGDTAASPAR
jgi:glycosyltransferase involved in cell wall biosynthesis